jgi:hypothetical protein
MDQLEGSTPFFGGIADERLTGVFSGSLEAWAADFGGLLFWTGFSGN